MTIWLTRILFATFSTSSSTDFQKPPRILEFVRMQVGSQKLTPLCQHSPLTSASAFGRRRSSCQLKTYGITEPKAQEDFFYTDLHDSHVSNMVKTKASPLLLPFFLSRELLCPQVILSTISPCPFHLPCPALLRTEPTSTTTAFPWLPDHQYLVLA
jgi:hypothetical protein